MDEEGQALVQEAASQGLCSSTQWPVLREYIGKRILENFSALLGIQEKQELPRKGHYAEPGECIALLEQLEEPPFTLQRLAEIAIGPSPQYNNAQKYLNGVRRVLDVGQPATLWNMQAWQEPQGIGGVDAPQHEVQPTEVNPVVEVPRSVAGTPLTVHGDTVEHGEPQWDAESLSDVEGGDAVSDVQKSDDTGKVDLQSDVESQSEGEHLGYPEQVERKRRTEVHVPRESTEVKMAKPIITQTYRGALSKGLEPPLEEELNFLLSDESSDEDDDGVGPHLGATVEQAHSIPNSRRSSFSSEVHSPASRTLDPMPLQASPTGGLVDEVDAAGAVDVHSRLSPNYREVLKSYMHDEDRHEGIDEGRERKKMREDDSLRQREKDA